MFLMSLEIKIEDVKSQAGKRSFELLSDMFFGKDKDYQIIDWWYSTNRDMDDLSPREYAIQYGQEAVFEKLWTVYSGGED